jgi:hypothetical protein
MGDGLRISCLLRRHLPKAELRSIMNAIKLDTLSAADGTVAFRLPEPGRFYVHIVASWVPMERDRKALFDEIRRRAQPDVLALLEKVGEDGIANPEGLLSWGCIDDPTLERPTQPPLERREPLE